MNAKMNDKGGKAVNELLTRFVQCVSSVLELEESRFCANLRGEWEYLEWLCNS